MRTFQRGDERLTLHVREGKRGMTLVASGDGELRSYSFHDTAALMKFESEMEEFLLEVGWTPVRFTADAEPLAETVPADAPLRAARRRASPLTYSATATATKLH